MKSSYERMFTERWGMTPSLVKLTAFLFVGLFLGLPLLLHNSDRFHRYFGVAPPVNSGAFLNPKPTRTDGSILTLIDDIREAVRVAAKGSDVTFSAEDRQAWEEQFPCRSRLELNFLYEKKRNAQYVPVNQQWQKVLDEYAVLHRVCMRAVGDLATYFWSRNESTGCKFIVAEAHYGLGNKILHTSSLLMYAVLTQRVILIPSSTSIPSIMCEPFPGSSWSMSYDVHRLVEANRRTRKQVYGAIDEEVLTNRSMTIYAGEGGNEWGPDMRFWCATEQVLLSTVTWLTIDGCLHNLPKLFSIPQFRPILEALFPRRVVLTHVLRTVMLPADPVWARIVLVEKAHLANAQRQVGVQVRFLHGGEKQYNKDNMPVNEHIIKCLWDNGLLPEVCPETTMSDATLEDEKYANCSSSSVIESNPRPRLTKVLIASLFLGFHDYLNNIYLRRETLGGEIVSVVQLSHEKTQGTGVDVDSQALVEMMTLSFSEVLLVTPFSTFGGVAQAYGSLIPYFIEYNNLTAEVPCQLGISTEPCYLGSGPFYECRYEETQQKSIVDFVPYLKRCMHIDVGDDYAMLMMNGP